VIKTENKTVNISSVHSAMITFVLLWSVFSPLQEVLNFTFIASLFLIWFLSAIFVRKKFFLECCKANLIYFIFYIILVLRVFFAENKDEVSQYFNCQGLLYKFAMIFIFFCAFIYYKDKSSKYKKNLLLMLLTAYTVSCVISLYYLSKDKYIYRDNFDLTRHFGLASHDFIYTSIILASFLLYLIVRNKHNRTLYLIVIIIMSLLTLKTNYTTAIILYIVFIGYIIIELCVKKNKLIIWITATAIILLFFVFKSDILSCLGSFINSMKISDVVRARLLELIDAMSGSLGNESDLSIRFTLQNVSKNTFLANPLFGVNYSNYNEITVGQHSQWMDNLAQFGIIGNTILISYFIYIYKYTRKFAFTIISRQCINFSWIFFIVFGFLNPNMRATFFLCMFIFAPFLNSLCSPDKTVATELLNKQ